MCVVNNLEINFSVKINISMIIFIKKWGWETKSQQKDLRTNKLKQYRDKKQSIMYLEMQKIDV